MKKNHNDHQKGLCVYVREGEPIEKALRRLTRKVKENKILEELREREYYTKPAEKRKKAKAAARARWLKYLKKQELK